MSMCVRVFYTYSQIYNVQRSEILNKNRLILYFPILFIKNKKQQNIDTYWFILLIFWLPRLQETKKHD